MKRLLLALLALGCAAPRPPPTIAKERPAIYGLPGESVGHLYARFLVRACTAGEDETVVAEALFLLIHCKQSFPDVADFCDASICNVLHDAYPPITRAP